MISDEGMEALRLAATLAHTLPLHLRIRHDDRVLLEVARPPVEPTEETRWYPPCGFRNAVADAWLAHRTGRRLALEGLPHGCDPTVEIGVPPGGRSLTGGIHAVPFDGMALFAFATPADGANARALADALGLGVHVDDKTDVALLHLATSRPCDEPDVVEVLEEALARITTEQLLAEVARTGAC